MGIARGGSRKLFSEGHIGLKSPKTTKRNAESVEGGEVWGGDLPPPQSTRGLRGLHKLPQRGLRAESQPLMIFGHYVRNFVRFHACFSAFWNLTGKANKTDPIRLFLSAIGLEGARAPCAPAWIRPWA